MLAGGEGTQILDVHTVAGGDLLVDSACELGDDGVGLLIGDTSLFGQGLGQHRCIDLFHSETLLF